MSSSTISLPHRHVWVDVGKALSIILVVLHHLIGTWSAPSWVVEVNNSILPFRMPFFFFMSGIFVSKIKYQSIGDIIGTRISVLIYIFALWSIIKIFIVSAGQFVINDGDFLTTEYFHIFTYPQSTLWFIYALAIYTFALWAISRLSKLIILSISVAIYFTLYFDGDVNSMLMWQKIGRFFLCFVLGYLLSKRVLTLANYVQCWHLLFVVIYFASSYIVFSETNDVGSVITLAFALAAVPIGVILSVLISRSPYSYALEVVGKNTLPIYLMHFVFVMILSRMPWVDANQIISLVLSLLVCITLPIIIHNYLIKVGFSWLFKLPRFRTH